MRGVRKPAHLVSTLGYVTVAAALALGASQVAAGGHATAMSDPATPQAFETTVSAPGHASVRLHAVEAGSGPVIVLLHGIGGSTYTWRNVLPTLARTHHVIAIDLKGFGASEKPLDDAYSPVDQAVLVVDFLARRGLTDVTLAGHSLGGTVALLAAMQLTRRIEASSLARNTADVAPPRVSRLVLMDAPAYPQPMSFAIAFLRAPFWPRFILDLVPPEWPARMALVRQQEAATISESDIAAYAAPYREEGARHALIATALALEPENWHAVTSGFAGIRQPTLLVWCLDDTLVPASTGLRLSRTLPASDLKTIEGCAHSPPDERPAELVSILQRWLAATAPDKVGQRPIPQGTAGRQRAGTRNRDPMPPAPSRSAGL